MQLQEKHFCDTKLYLLQCTAKNLFDNCAISVTLSGTLNNIYIHMNRQSTITLCANIKGDVREGTHLDLHNREHKRTVKMKTVVVLLLAAVVYVNADASESSEEIDLKELSKFFATKASDKAKAVENLKTAYTKTKSKCPNLEDDAKDMVEKVMKCIEEIKVDSNTICKVIKENFKKCTEPVVELINKCVDDEYKYAAPMATKLITGFLDQACNSTVEEVLELLNPCVVDNDEEDKIPSCKEVNDVTDADDDKIPTKKEICDLVPKCKECMVALTNTCKNPLTKKAAMNFYEVSHEIMQDECNAV